MHTISHNKSELAFQSSLM